MKLGIYTFVERIPDAVTGHSISPERRLRNLLEEIALADQVGWPRLCGARRPSR
jgi:hypothetical protein